MNTKAKPSVFCWPLFWLIIPTKTGWCTGNIWESLVQCGS